MAAVSSPPSVRSCRTARSLGTKKASAPSSPTGATALLAQPATISASAQASGQKRATADFSLAGQHANFFHSASLEAFSPWIEALAIRVAGAVLGASFYCGALIGDEIRLAGEPALALRIVITGVAESAAGGRAAGGQEQGESE